MSHTTKPDLVLHDGREIAFDLYQISQREYRSLFDPKQPDSEADAVLAKTCSLSADEIADLPQPDFRRLMAAFITKARKPVDDANDPN